MAASSIKFTVRRRAAVLVAPASPTPRELKLLSDLDDHDGHRHQARGIFFYSGKGSSMAMEDPAVVIRDAVARALVPYYPFAGRLREHGGGKLAVDCTGEGVLFVEADADVRLEQFGDPMLPPFPCVEELIFDVPGSSAILDTPLLLIQVTRLACGGFVLGLRLNHTMVDGPGQAQFLGAVAELARGEAPTVQPVWERHLLQGRRRRSNDDPHTPPPLISDVVSYNSGSSTSAVLSSSLINNREGHDMTLRYLFFGPGEMAAIRAQLPPDDHLLLRKRASRFDLMAGWLWKCRTMALAPADPNEPTFMVVVINARGRAGIIPAGYYGNACAAPVAASTAGELCANPVGYAVGLVKEAREKVGMEYVRSLADLVVLRGRRSPRFAAGAYFLSDVTKAGFDGLDFGWGRPVYGGPAQVVGSPTLPPWALSFVLPFRDAGAVVPVRLPRLAMDRLVHEMGKLRSPDDLLRQQQQPGPPHGFPAVVVRWSSAL